MRLRFTFLHSAPLCVLGFVMQTATAAAQEPPPPPPPAAPPPEAAAAAETPPAAVVAPGPVEVFLFISNGSSPAALNHPSGEGLDDTFSTGEFEFHASGKVWKFVSLTLNLVASYTPDITSSVTVMDGIVQLEPSPYFNVWLGRHLVSVDRANAAGPYFMSPWLYPGFGFADGQVGAPFEGPYGRNDGVTVWGQVEGGLFKYFAGAFDLHLPGQAPLYTGRLTLSLLNPEPGFWGTATYHGLDVLGIGVGAQYKNDGQVTPGATPAAPPIDVQDYAEVNVDVLFEKNLGDAGVFDIEAAYYKYLADNSPTDAHWYGLVSYILPGDVGDGKLQPLVRVQQALSNIDGADDATLVDAQVNYIVNSYATRFSLGYRFGTAGDAFDKISAVYFGVQVQK
jgi:hypothetical protein